MLNSHRAPNSLGAFGTAPNFRSNTDRVQQGQRGKDAPDFRALDGVRSKTDRVCPLICAKGQHADGDHCVQISCGRSHFLNSSGESEKRPNLGPKVRTAH